MPYKPVHWHIKFRLESEAVYGVNYVVYKLVNDDWAIVSQGKLRPNQDTHVFQLHTAGNYKIYAWKQIPNGVISGTLELEVTPDMIHEPPPERVEAIMNMDFKSWDDIITTPITTNEELSGIVAGPVYFEPMPPNANKPVRVPSEVVDLPSIPDRYIVPDEKQRKAYIRYEDSVARIVDGELIFVDKHDVPPDELPESDHFAYESLIMAHALDNIADSIADKLRPGEPFNPIILPNDKLNRFPNDDPYKNVLNIFMEVEPIVLPGYKIVRIKFVDLSRPGLEQLIDVLPFKAYLNGTLIYELEERIYGETSYDLRVEDTGTLRIVVYWSYVPEGMIRRIYEGEGSIDINVLDGETVTLKVEIMIYQ